MQSNFQGDMSAEEFRKYGYQLIDWIAELILSMINHIL